MLIYPERDRVLHVARCELRVGVGAWPYAEENCSAIEAHWQRAQAANPNYFNGTVHVAVALARRGDALVARFIAAEFKSYLFWRDAGYPPTGIRDGFGSALFVSSDGAYVLGRQRSGNINAGLAYLPGGFIDSRDVDAQGDIDIAGSILREVKEETGLVPGDFSVRSGFLVTEQGPQLSFAKCLDVAMPAMELKACIEQHIAADAAAELEDAVIVRALSDLDGLAMAPFARLLLTTLLTNRSGPG